MILSERRIGDESDGQDRYFISSVNQNSKKSAEKSLQVSASMRKRPKVASKPRGCSAFGMRIIS